MGGGRSRPEIALDAVHGANIAIIDRTVKEASGTVQWPE
jgi:hypothetical protein